jgi:transposase
VNGLAADAVAVGDLEHGSGLSRYRWVVERTFAWLHQFKRLRIRWEYRANVQDELGILVEVEAGRGAKGNAVHRDLVRSSLIVDQRVLCLG